MKFALNGALTMGTLDGANVEMAEEIGTENMFIFGLNAAQVSQIKSSGYNPQSYYQNDPELRRVVDSLMDDTWCKNEPGIFAPIFDSLMSGGDPYLNLADFRAFVDTSARVDELYTERDEWVQKAILNIARVGKFSSDRAIKEYAEEIWNIKALVLNLDA